MISYYTVLIILCWMALGVLCILVHEISWICKEDKHLFYLTYGIVALSALAEWLGVQLNGNTAVPVWVLSAVKCIDYILTPMAGGAIVAQMKLKNRIFAGYVREKDYKGLTAEELTKRADKAMYASKAAYYLKRL